MGGACECSARVTGDVESALMSGNATNQELAGASVIYVYIQQPSSRRASKICCLRFHAAALFTS
jgi:hypothetical protein